MESQKIGFFSISGGSFASPLGRLHSQKNAPPKKQNADRVAALPPGVRKPEKAFKWCRIVATHRMEGDGPVLGHTKQQKTKQANLNYSKRNKQTCKQLNKRQQLTSLLQQPEGP